jgi:hypothetical protein
VRLREDKAGRSFAYTNRYMNKYRYRWREGKSMGRGEKTGDLSCGTSGASTD